MSALILGAKIRGDTFSAIDCLQIDSHPKLSFLRFTSFLLHVAVDVLRFMRPRQACRKVIVTGFGVEGLGLRV